MAIDETNTLTLWNNVSAWSIYLVIKIAGIITMMLLGFYQTMRAFETTTTGPSFCTDD